MIFKKVYKNISRNLIACSKQNMLVVWLSSLPRKDWVRCLASPRDTLRKKLELK